MAFVVSCRSAAAQADSLPPSYLGFAMEVGLSPIGEDGESIEVEVEVGDSSAMVAMPLAEVGQSVQRVEAESLVSPVMPELRPISEMEILGRGSSSAFSGSQLLSQLVADVLPRSSIVAGEDASSGEPVSRVQVCPHCCVLPSSDDEFGASRHESGGTFDAVGQMISGEKWGGELPTIPVSSPVLCHGRRDASILGQRVVSEGMEGAAGILVEDFVRADSYFLGTVHPVTATLADGPLSLMSCDRRGIDDIGVVSEEARVPQVARGALRPQPTDGLRQPPLSPVVPVSGVDGGLGMDGRAQELPYGDWLTMVFEAFNVPLVDKQGEEPKRRRDDEIDAPTTNEEVNEEEEAQHNFEWEAVHEEAEIQGESGSGSEEKFFYTEDEVQGSEDVIEEVPIVPAPTSVQQKEIEASGVDPSAPTRTIPDSILMSLQAELERAQANRIQDELDKAQAKNARLSAPAPTS
ncbi:hypothetical protein Dimus_006011 [Dionaea muscipula]